MQEAGEGTSPILFLLKVTYKFQGRHRMALTYIFTYLFVTMIMVSSIQ